MSRFLSAVAKSCHVLINPASECVSDHGKSACTNIGGKCVTETDGYYVVSGICLAFGVIFLIAYIIPTARRLQGQCSSQAVSCLNVNFYSATSVQVESSSNLALLSALLSSFT